MSTEFSNEWLAVSLKLNGRTIRIVVPYEFEWARVHRVDLSTWLEGYRDE